MVIAMGSYPVLAAWMNIGAVTPLGARRETLGSNIATKPLPKHWNRFPQLLKTTVLPIFAIDFDTTSALCLSDRSDRVRSNCIHQVVVCDGTPEADERIRRVLANDPMMGIFRHADAGYEDARRCADEQGVKIPMA